jgi:hypothetical protein
MSQLKRIVVTVGNEIGVLADITRVLAEGGINLEGISTEASGHQGIVIITVREDNHPLALLNQAGYKAVSEDAVVIRLADIPGALARVAEELKQAGVNIRNLHILNRQDGYATVALTTSNQTLARAVIKSASVI